MWKLITLLPKSNNYPDIVSWQTLLVGYNELCLWAMVDCSDEDTHASKPFVLLY